MKGLVPVEARAWVGNATAYCASEPRLLMHARTGRDRPAPKPVAALPSRVRRVVEGVVRSVRPERAACYRNAFLAAWKEPACTYVEGVSQGPANRAPVPHAWVEVEGYTVDITRMLVMGPLYPNAVGDEAFRFFYYGTGYSRALVEHLARVRPHDLRPVAELLALDLLDAEAKHLMERTQ